MRSNGSADALKLLALISMGVEGLAAKLPDGREKQSHEKVAAILSRVIRDEAGKEGVMDDLLVLSASPKHA